MPKSARIISTWEALIKATDASIAELSMKLYSDPANATQYQRNITILMLRKQEAIIRKRMGEDEVTREAYQELIEELAENTRYLSTDAEWYAVYPSKGYAERILTRTKSMHEALSEIEATVQNTEKQERIVVNSKEQ